MSEENEMDVALEQLGLLIAGEDYKNAGLLLQKVLNEGDDAQREMAELYMMQLQEVAPEFMIEVVSSDGSNGLVEETATENEIDVALEKLALFVSEGSTLRAEALLAKILSEGDEAQREMAEIYQLQLAEMQPSQPVEKIAVGTDDMEPIQSENTDSFALQEAESESKEYEVALEQALLLVNDGEIDTAAILLEPVLKMGSNAQKALARDYLSVKAANAEEAKDAAIGMVETVPIGSSEMVDDEFTPSDSAVFSNNIEQVESFVTSPSMTTSTVTASDDNPFSSGDIFGLNNHDRFEMTTSTDVATESDVTSSESMRELSLPLDALRTDEAFVSQSMSTNTDHDTQLDLEKRQGFLVGNVGLMIKYIDGSQLVEMPDVYQLPGAPDWFKGIANLNGNTVPVFDLARYFGFTSVSSKKPMLLVLSREENATGVIIDRLPNRLEWSASQVVGRNNAPDGLVGHVHTACMIDEKLWFDLDVTSLCDALENGLAA